jgi:hypothetical protein
LHKRLPQDDANLILMQEGVEGMLEEVGLSNNLEQLIGAGKALAEAVLERKSAQNAEAPQEIPAWE